MITQKTLIALEKEIVDDGIFSLDHKGFTVSDVFRLARVGLAYEAAKEQITTDMIPVSGVYHSSDLQPTHYFTEPKRTAPGVY